MWLAPDRPGESSGGDGARHDTGLAGAVIVVTGAGTTAGPALVQRFAALGAFVVAVDTEESRLAPVVESVLAAGGRCAGRVVDLVDERATYAWASSLVDQCGHIDGLVHLVGGASGMSAIRADTSDWDWMQSLVVRTLQNASLALQEQLQASERGRLVFVSSLEGGRPTGANAYYAAAQAAAEAWVLAMADSFRGTRAAATVVSTRGLISDAVLRGRPRSALEGFVDVSVLVEAIEVMWRPSTLDLNGARVTLGG